MYEKEGLDKVAYRTFMTGFYSCSYHPGEILDPAELAERYGVKMQQIALAWHWAKGVASPIIGATKARYLDDAVGAIDRNPADGVVRAALPTTS